MQSRKKRIAKGCGTSIQEVNRLLKQFEEMKKMMKQMTNMQQKGKKKGGFKFRLNRFNVNFFYGINIQCLLRKNTLQT